MNEVVPAHGSTRSVLLLHAGIADSRMWRPQIEALTGTGFQVAHPDLRGFGDRPFGAEAFSHVSDVEALLVTPAHVVGCSLGGRVALELAVHRPDLVASLVLIAPGLPGWDWSEETRAGWAAEAAAYERGDAAAAAEASLRLWVDGPRRTADDVDKAIRDAVRAMVLRSYELERQAAEPGTTEAPILDPPVAARLGEIRGPTLVIVGEEDVPDMQAIAAHVARSIDGARLVTVSGAAHLPSLERPDEVNAHLLAFFRGAEVPEARVRPRARRS